MKRSILFLCLSLPLLLVAEEPNLTRKTIEMRQLWNAGKYLEAIDTATVILAINDENRTATDFVYHHWDRMQQKTEDRLRSLSDPNDIDQAIERCEIYRLLDDIHSNLSVVRMPLYGSNQRWAWQPELGYYSGHYDTERIRGYELAIRRANEALESYETDEAYSWIELALNTFLISDGERRSNRKLIAQQINERLLKVKDSDKRREIIYAYDLAQLSLRLLTPQPDVEQTLQQLQSQLEEE